MISQSNRVPLQRIIAVPVPSHGAWPPDFAYRLVLVP